MDQALMVQLLKVGSYHFLVFKRYLGTLSTRLELLKIVSDSVLFHSETFVFILFRIAADCGAPPTTQAPPSDTTTSTQASPVTTTTGTTVAGTTSTTTPFATAPPPDPNCSAVSAVCGPSTTCDSLGYTGMCCSQYGVSSFLFATMI